MQVCCDKCEDCFFFSSRRRHTRFDCDWSSDVCSSDLLAQGDELHPVQAAFHESHALQCGFCTAGMVMATVSLLDEIPSPTERDVRLGLEGNLCRCTGYHNIVKAVLAAAGTSP